MSSTLRTNTTSTTVAHKNYSLLPKDFSQWDFIFENCLKIKEIRSLFLHYLQTVEHSPEPLEFLDLIQLQLYPAFVQFFNQFNQSNSNILLYTIIPLIETILVEFIKPSSPKELNLSQTVKQHVIHQYSLLKTEVLQKLDEPPEWLTNPSVGVPQWIPHNRHSCRMRSKGFKKSLQIQISPQLSNHSDSFVKSNDFSSEENSNHSSPNGSLTEMQHKSSYVSLFEDSDVESEVSETTSTYSITSGKRRIKSKFSNLKESLNQDQYFALFQQVENLISFFLKSDSFGRFVRSDTWKSYILENLNNKSLLDTITIYYSKYSNPQFVLYTSDEIYYPLITFKDFQFAEQFNEDNCSLWKMKYTSPDFLTCWYRNNKINYFVNEEQMDSFFKDVSISKLVYFVPYHFETVFKVKMSDKYLPDPNVTFMQKLISISPISTIGSETEETQLSNYLSGFGLSTNVLGNKTTSKQLPRGTLASAISHMEFALQHALISNREIVVNISARKFAATADGRPERIIVIAKPTNDSNIPKRHTNNVRTKMIWAIMYYKIQEELTRVVQVNFINFGGNLSKISKKIAPVLGKKRAEKERQLVMEAIEQYLKEKPTKLHTHGIFEAYEENNKLVL